MSDHTPGPWTFDKADDNTWHIRDASGESMMCDQHHYPWVPNNEADWNLIAAAPELYKALAKIVSQGEPLRAVNELWSSWQSRVRDWEVAHVALFKAEGKPVSNAQ